MARWEGDGLGRLERAALELFAERGYERTTVAQIAQRAGLTERSFYRHFPDKREVLFAGGEDLQRHLVAAVHDSPPSTDPLDALVAAVAGASVTFRTRAFLQQRVAVIAANPALLERELVKLAAMSEALVGALVASGTDADVAALAAGVAVTVMRVAVLRWIASEQDYAAVVAAVAAELGGVVGRASIAGTGTAPPAR